MAFTDEIPSPMNDQTRPCPRAPPCTRDDPKKRNIQIAPCLQPLGNESERKRTVGT